MYGVLIFVHLLVSVVLVLVVLMQQPQKGGMASIMGGGESIFGGGGAAPFMTRLTTVLAVVFMLTSLGLVLLSSRRPARAASPLPASAPTEGPVVPTEPEPDEPAPLGG